jgi:hypothetical protein
LERSPECPLNHLAERVGHAGSGRSQLRQDLALGVADHLIGYVAEAKGAGPFGQLFENGHGVWLSIPRLCLGV